MSIPYSISSIQGIGHNYLIKKVLDKLQIILYHIFNW